MSEPIDVPADLMAGFLDEAPVYLATLEDRLLSFEEQARSGTIAIRDDGDKERINEIFRAAHSLKGLAASLGFSRIRDVTHIMESIFDQLRNGARELSGRDVEGLFSVVDVLRALVEELTAPDAAPVDIQPHLERLRAILHGAQVAPNPKSIRTPSPAVTCDDAELFRRFVESAAEMLDEANEQLLKLEKQPKDIETINAVFRAAHNLKGACGAIGCASLERFTHDLETVLDRVRQGQVIIDAALITAMLKALDAIRTDVAAISESGRSNATDAVFAAYFAPWLETSAPSVAPASHPDCGETAHDGTQDPEWTIVVAFPKGFADAPIQACILHNRLSDLGEIVSTNPDVDTLETSSIVERLTIRIRTDVDPAVLERVIRAYSIESVTISAAGSVARIECPGPARADTTTETIESANGSNPPESGRRDPGPRPADGPRSGETLRVDLERLDQLMNLGGELVSTKARFSEIQRRLDEVLPRTNIVGLLEGMAERLTRLRGGIEALRAAGVAALGEASEVVESLNDDLRRIRTLVGGVEDSRGAMSAFAETVHGLNRIAESMQKRIMQTRMVPIGPLFQRFRRVVRDIARSTGKKVELVVHGEQTELDKRMIDELVDPLTHLVRNSVDHGVESPAARLAAGKPDVATVTLTAFHSGRHICVQVCDDGAGVNVERVRRRIVERELATRTQVDAMSDRDVCQYIFRPGFSTAETVTDLSGRGMGMDIVLSKIESVSGTVELDSAPGEGTTVTINLPLTLAIINAMVVRIGSTTYAIPLETVVEVLSVPRSSIRSIQRRPVVQIRDRVIPLGYFEQIFRTSLPQQNPDSADARNVTVVVLGFQNQRLGLVVDRMIGREDVVIKDIASNFRNVPGVAGASVMGDGSVALILDVPAMMARFAGRTAEPSPICQPTGQELALIR